MLCLVLEMASQTGLRICTSTIVSVCGGRVSMIVVLCPMLETASQLKLELYLDNRFRLWWQSFGDHYTLHLNNGFRLCWQCLRDHDTLRIVRKGSISGLVYCTSRTVSVSAGSVCVNDVVETSTTVSVWL